MSTFGKITAGASNEALAAGDKRFCKFTTPADIGSVDEFFAYVDRAGSLDGYQVRAAVYADAAGVPGALVANSAIQLHQSIAKDTAAWYSIKYPRAAKPSLTPSTAYWLGVQAVKAIKTYYDTGDAAQEKEGSDAYAGGIADPFGVVAATHAHAMSVYVVYTPVVAGRFDDLLPDPDIAAEVQRDLVSVAMTVWGEARGTSILQKTGVAWVIKNRALLNLTQRPDFDQADLEAEMNRQVQRGSGATSAFIVWDSVTPNVNYAKLVDPLGNGTAWEWESSAAVAYHVAKYPREIAKRPTEAGFDYSDPTHGAQFFYTVGSIPTAIAAATFKTRIIGSHHFYRYKIFNEYFA